MSIISVLFNSYINDENFIWPDEDIIILLGELFPKSTFYIDSDYIVNFKLNERDVERLIELYDM
jgi:hypothetical protein